jgi:hypothetical protein
MHVLINSQIYIQDDDRKVKKKEKINKNENKRKEAKI